MATKKMRTQCMQNIYYTIYGIVLCLLMGYIGVQIYFHGLGERGSSIGLKGLFARFLYQLEDQGKGNLANWIMLTILALSTIYTLCVTIWRLLHITPGLTVLGRSIKRQVSGNETFRELCHQIDVDMELDKTCFGKDVYISSSWILAKEAMRLKSIQNIMKANTRLYYQLILEDVNGNHMIINFDKQEDRKKTASYLRKQLSL